MAKNGFTRKSVAAMLGLGLACAASAVAEPTEGPFVIEDDEHPDACEAGAQQLRVTVDGLDGSGGVLVVDLYGDDPDVFLNKKGRLRRVRTPAAVYEDGTGSQTFCMGGVAPGTYAMSSYHDQDADRDLDKHWNLMPKEPFALSNDPDLKLGFPPIEPSLFSVGPGGAEVRLVLRTAEDR